MNMFRVSLVSIAAFGALCSAQAATDLANINVKITISKTCTISTTAPTDVDFGSVPSTATDVLSSGGVLTANCTVGTPYSIALNNGQNYDTTRRMKNGSSYVAYDLYSNNSRTVAWGSGLGATVSGTGTGISASHTVYGKVPSANSIAGTYADIVQATITY